MNVREAAANLPAESAEPEPLDKGGAFTDNDEEMTGDLDTIPQEVEA